MKRRSDTERTSPLQPWSLLPLDFWNIIFISSLFFKLHIYSFFAFVFIFRFTYAIGDDWQAHSRLLWKVWFPFILFRHCFYNLDNFFSFPCPISSSLFAIVHSIFISITDISLSITLLIRQVNYLNIETMRHVIGRHSHLLQKKNLEKISLFLKSQICFFSHFKGRVCLRMRISHLCKYYLKMESPSSSQVCVCVCLWMFILNFCLRASVCVWESVSLIMKDDMDQ